MLSPWLSGEQLLVEEGPKLTLLWHGWSSPPLRSAILSVAGGLAGVVAVHRVLAPKSWVTGVHVGVTTFTGVPGKGPVARTLLQMDTLAFEFCHSPLPANARVVIGYVTNMEVVKEGRELRVWVRRAEGNWTVPVQRACEKVGDMEDVDWRTLANALGRPEDVMLVWSWDGTLVTPTPASSAAIARMEAARKRAWKLN